MKDMFGLKGHVAIVTGSSTGLGQGICKAYVEAGAKVVGVDYVESTATKEMLGDNFHGIVANLMTVDPINDIVNKTVEIFGQIDILVNNAGIIRREDSINFSEKDWDDVISLNAKTVFFFSQAVARRFLEQKSGGKIINIASMLSYQGGIRCPSYTASKSAVKGITMTMANEWAKHNINVNAIAPGFIDTDMTEGLSGKVKEKIISQIPFGRLGKPEDVAKAAAFLASDGAGYITGQVLCVDGGMV